MKLKLNDRNCKKCLKAQIIGTIDDCEVICNSLDYTESINLKNRGCDGAMSCNGYIENKGKVNRLGNIELSKALDYMTAGKSEFILYSTKTNQEFGYRLTKKVSNNSNNKDNNKEEYIYFLNIKFGRDWRYAGVVWFDDNIKEFRFAKGKKGDVDESDLNVRSLLFVLNKLIRNEEPLHCEVFHTGLCGACGKKLTTPESILTGLGPTCSKRKGIPRVKIEKQ